MGFKLRREVRDHLPPGLLTAGERCLVLELADACDDDDRTGLPGLDWLARKADVPEAKVGDMLSRIAKKWTELRVPLGVGRDGRPFYSKPKHRTRFCFPPAAEVARLAKAKVPQNGGPCKAPQNGGPKAPQNGGPLSATRPPKLGDPSPLLPEREPLSLSQDERDESASRLSAAHRVLTAQGINRAEADRLIPIIEEIHKVRAPRVWWNRIEQEGDTAAVLAAGRKALATGNHPDRPWHNDPYRNADPSAYEDWGGTPATATEGTAA